MIKYLYFNISILNLIILLIYELKIKLNNIENIQKNIIFNIFMNFMGFGYWGLGIGDWAFSSFYSFTLQKYNEFHCKIKEKP